MRVLVVEDEINLLEAIAEGLKDNYFTVDIAHDGEEALNKIEVELDYDLIILDILLPKIDGVTLLKILRNKGFNIPVLMLTALDAIDTKIKSFELGADDYLTKPFDFRELLARVRALIRRTKEEKKSIINIDDLIIDTNKLEVKRGNKKINLSKKEFQILEYLALNKNKIVTKSELENHIWDEEAELWSDTIRSHIKNLRKKIDNGFKKKLIKTIRGVGYKISDE